MVRFSNYVFLFVSIALFCIVYFSPKTDTIKGVGIIVPKDPFQKIFAPYSGRIDTLFVLDGQLVKKGAALGIVGSDCDYKSILIIDSLLFRILNREILNDSVLNMNNIGVLQNGYEELKLMYLKWRNNKEMRLSSRKLSLLESYVLNSRIIDSLNNELRVSDSGKLTLLSENFSIQTVLKDSNVISRMDYLNERLKHVQGIDNNNRNNLQYIQFKNSLKDYEVRILEFLIGEMEFDYLLDSKVVELREQISNWKLNHIVFAPCDGVVQYNKRLGKNYWVEVNELMCYIVPNFSEYYCDLRISRLEIPNLDTTMSVRLEVNGLPKNRYGILVGKISSIDEYFDGSADSVYLRVRLRSGLTTDKGLKIKYYFNLRSRGEISIRRPLKELYSFMPF